LALSDIGEDERATAVLDENDGLPVAWNRASLLQARTEVEWAARRLERCIAIAEEAAAAGHPIIAELALLTRGWARLELGLDPDLPERFSNTSPVVAHQIPEADALRALAAGRPAEARVAFLRSARKLRGIFVRNELRALLGAAYASEAMGDVAGAKRQRRAIEERARAVGLVAICRRLEAPLEPSPRAALTPRRREVIELVAAGLSSAAIADRLGIARPTVESHIRWVMRETGARTRIEAAAQLLPKTHAPQLDPEGRRIVDLLATGATVTEAARLLHMSRRTLTRQLARIREQLGVTSNAALASRRRVSD
jgi:DNA-binding CsgD family transcriptional regulator